MNACHRWGSRLHWIMKVKICNFSYFMWEKKKRYFKDILCKAENGEEWVGIVILNRTFKWVLFIFNVCIRWFEEGFEFQEALNFFKEFNAPSIQCHIIRSYKGTIFPYAWLVQKHFIESLNVKRILFILNRCLPSMALFEIYLLICRMVWIILSFQEVSRRI